VKNSLGVLDWGVNKGEKQRQKQRRYLVVPAAPSLQPSAEWKGFWVDCNARTKVRAYPRSNGNDNDQGKSGLRFYIPPFANCCEHPIGWGGWRRAVVCCRKRYPTLSHPTSRAGGDPGIAKCAKAWGTRFCGGHRVRCRFTHLSDDEAVAKMGHSVLWWSNPHT
jgi:hypothetical protein